MMPEINLNLFTKSLVLAKYISITKIFLVYLLRNKYNLKKVMKW